jgi:hypothetical protein
VFVKQPKVRIAKYLPLRSQIDGVYPWRIVVHSIVIVRDIKYFPLSMISCYCSIVTKHDSFF